MFTGIVECKAKILKRDGADLTIARPVHFDDLKIGSSIAIAGTCLTVVAFDDQTMLFNVVPETFARTSLGSKKEGDHVNLERSMRADGRFEGHIVQGHIEATGKVLGLEMLKDQAWAAAMLTIELPKDVLPAVAPKGSIAIDGVSLTVASLEGNRLGIALIPHTLEITTLGELQAGDLVNIETDIFARMLMRHLATMKV